MTDATKMYHVENSSRDDHPLEKIMSMFTCCM